MRDLLFLIILLTGQALCAQNIWDFPHPRIDTSEYSITDTVYLSPTGSDTGDGSESEPLATFSVALDRLPFGEIGIRGGHAYGLVRLLPGNYELDIGMHQLSNQYRQGNTFKNVSVEGVGQVVIGGRADDPCTGQALLLRGSHIFVRNLDIRYASLQGLQVSPDQGRISSLLIDDVQVDSVQGFSMLITDVDTISVSNSRSLYASRLDTSGLGINCQWPSGIKFLGCEWVVIHDTEIGYTRGEGLNFQNSEYCLAYDNLLHDNSSNIYCDNSARVVVRNNFNYSTPGAEAFWNTCPADSSLDSGSAGVLLANEGSCGFGQPSFYQFCRTDCPTTGESYAQIDSIFVFNNIFANTSPALSLWQGVTTHLGGPNCLKNIYFQHNAVVGFAGNPSFGRQNVINAFFPNQQIFNGGYALVENLVIENNLFSFDAHTYPEAQLIGITRATNLPSPFDYRFENNLVVTEDDEIDESNRIEPTLPTSLPLEVDMAAETMRACGDTSALWYAAPIVDWIGNDFLYRERNANNNISGALVGEPTCISSDPIADLVPNNYRIYPNPGNQFLMIARIENVAGSSAAKLDLYDLHGRIVNSAIWYDQSLPFTLVTSNLPRGNYLLRLTDSEGTFRSWKWLK